MSQPIPLRVMVHESWDEVSLEVAPETTIVVVGCNRVWQNVNVKVDVKASYNLA